MMDAERAHRRGGSPARPNILFILTDDQGPWTLGAEGHANARTPVLDRLVAEGAHLRSMFANSAVCSPARASILTGRYPSEVGFSTDGLVFIASDDRHLDPTIPGWPAALRNDGYRTALIGKWHLGHGREEYAPTRNGYERFRGFPIGGEVSRDPRLEIDGEWKEFPGEYTSDVLADLAIETIREWRDEPFAVSLHFWAPHANTRFPQGYEPPYPACDPATGKRNRSWLPLKEEDLQHWRETSPTLPDPDFPNIDAPYVERMMREYYASVHSVDRNVGRVLAALDETSRARDTIVIFTSDQGYNLGHHGIWHKGNGWWVTVDGKDPEGVYTTFNTGMRVDERHNIYDHSLRVPTVVRWPAVIPAGTVVTRSVSFVDLFPTILAATSAACPSTARLTGSDFLPLLRGETVGDWDDTVFAEYDRLRCIRTPDWKLILSYRPDEPDELYDLRADPGERRNRIGEKEHPELAPVYRDLARRLTDHMRAIGDRLATSRVIR